MSSEPATELYASFMGEIKTRLAGVREILLSLRPSETIPENAYLQAEAAFLQVRFICELVALASLAAHNGMALSKSLLKEYHAGNIFRALERLNPHSFPKAIEPHSPANPVIRSKKDCLDREGMETIYNGCGGMLHRGVLKHALRSAPRHYDLVKVNEWRAQIADLLENHMILLQDLGIILIVMMEGSDGSKRVEVLTCALP